MDYAPPPDVKPPAMMSHELQWRFSRQNDFKTQERREVHGELISGHLLSDDVHDGRPIWPDFAITASGMRPAFALGAKGGDVILGIAPGGIRTRNGILSGDLLIH